MNLRAQDGLTLVEVLVAGLLLTVGAFGVLAASGAGKRTTLGSERAQLVATFAQREIERIAALAATPAGFASLGLSALPAPAADETPSEPAPSTPAAYLADCGTSGCTRLRILQDPSDRTSPPPAGVSADGEELVAGGTLTPLEQVSLDGTAATLHRFVTWAPERCLQTGGALHCPPAGQAKRIAVAVVLAGPKSSGVTKPVWISTLVTDPAVRPVGAAA